MISANRLFKSTNFTIPGFRNKIAQLHSFYCLGYSLILQVICLIAVINPQVNHMPFIRLKRFRQIPRCMNFQIAHQFAIIIIGQQCFFIKSSAVLVIFFQKHYQYSFMILPMQCIFQNNSFAWDLLLYFIQHRSGISQTIKNNHLRQCPNHLEVQPVFHLYDTA